jgi:hypothetical protein
MDKCTKRPVWRRAFSLSRADSRTRFWIPAGVLAGCAASGSRALGRSFGSFKIRALVASPHVGIAVPARRVQVLVR